MNKKILVRMLKDGWKKEGLTDRITIRQAEAWAFSDVVMDRKSFEIIDERVIITKTYPKCLDGKEVIEIKFKEKQDGKNS